MVMVADKKSSQTQIAQASFDETNQSVKISIVSGTITIPPGLATEAKQDVGNSSLSSIDTKVATSAKQDTGNSSLSSIDGKLPASLGQKAKTGSVSVTFASDADTVNVAGSVSVTDFPRLNSVTLTRNDYTASPVTTAAYTQLIASMPAAIKEIEIFDSSGETLVLAIGGAGSEVNKVYVFPGGNGRIPLQIAASARLSVKAISNNASSGELTINFYG